MSYTGPRSAKFSDPFMLPSSESFPDDVRDSLNLCLYLARQNPLYGAVVRRVASYFVTGIGFGKDSALDAEESSKYKKVLEDQLRVFEVMLQAGDEWGIYGQAFVRCIPAWDRYLIDTRNGKYTATPLSMYPREHTVYNYKDLTFTVPDIRATRDAKSSWGTLPKVTLKFRDKASSDMTRFAINFLDPRYVRMDKAHFNDHTEYIYRVPPDTTGRIRSGEYNEVVNTPEGFLRAVAEDMDFRFHRGDIFHFRPPGITGVSETGWAVPNILWQYEALYQMQVYRKSDQAVARDFMQPFRIFTPGGEMNSDAAAAQLDARLWKLEMARVIKNRRKDETSIHAMPYKVDYNEYGGNGKQYVNYELVELWTNTFFDGMGFPQELYRGSIAVDQLPNAIRMFERSYEWMFQAMQGLLLFISDKACDVLEYDNVAIHLKRPTVAVNAEHMALKMQLVANRETPRDSLFNELGLGSPVDEADAAMSEDHAISRAAIERSEEFERETTIGSLAEAAQNLTNLSQPGAAGPGGAPPGPGGASGGGLDYTPNVADDPQAIDQRATEIAMQWQQMHEEAPNSHRSEMRMAEATNPTLYAVAVKKLDQIRAEGASAGRAQSSQIAGGGG